MRAIGWRLGLALVLLGSVLGGGAAAQAPGEVRLSLERFEQLMAAARRGGGAAVTWGKGDVRVTLPEAGGAVARVEVNASLRVVGDGVAEVPLLPAEVALEGAALGGRDATLIERSGAHVALLGPAERDLGVSLRYLVPARAVDEGGHVAVVPLPPLPGAALTVSGRGADGALSVWPAAEVVAGGGVVRAALPAVSAAVLRWGDGVGGTRVRRVDYDLVVNEGIDAADVTARVDVVVVGPLADVRVARADVALMEAREGSEPLPTRVEDGAHVVRVRGAGRHVVEVQLRVAVDRSAGQPQVSFGLAGASILRIAADVPGERAVHLDPAVPLQSTVVGAGDAARTRVVGFLPPVDGVTVRWTEPRPSEEMAVRMNTETWQLVTLQEGVVRARVVLRVQILRGATKELSVALPEDVVPFKVTGDGIDDWRTFAATDEEPRQLRVFLAREIEGDYTLQLELETVVPKEEGTPIDVPVVRPLGAFRETGVVALFDGDKVGFAPADPAQYAKVGEDALPVDVRQTLTERVSQAFKHVGPPGPIRSSVAAAKIREVRFDARVETLYHVKEGAIVAYASVLVELKSGRTDVVRLSFPEGVTVLDVTAPSLNRHEDVPIETVAPGAAGEARKGHEIRLTRALEGAIQLDLELERLLERDTGAVVLPDVRVHGAEVEEGSFGVTADAGIEVQPAGPTDLRQVPVDELPKAVRLRSPREVLLGYRYARAPWQLPVAVKRHRTVETLDAVVEASWLDTAVLPDGHVVTRALYRVRNEDRQFLRLAMPKDNKVWTVAAGGAPVKAVADESGALAIPLPKGQTLVVEVVYEVGFEKFSFLGSVALQAPHPDLVVKGLQWLVRLPGDLTVHDVDTDIEEAEPWAWRAPPGDSTLDAPLDLATLGDMQQLVFTRAVHDPSEPPLELSLRLLKAPDGAFGWLVLLAAIVLAAAPVRRRAQRRPLSRLTWAALVAAVLLLVAKGVVWRFEVGEAILACVALVAVAVASWWLERRKGRSS
jgi:hypothetical protein